MGCLNWMGAEGGFETIDDFRGLSLPNVTEWKRLEPELPHRREDSRGQMYRGCQLCYTACWDGTHQCIHLDRG